MFPVETSTILPGPSRYLVLVSPPPPLSSCSRETAQGTPGTPGICAHEERAAGRPASVRALARANQCAAECVAYACAPVKHTTHFDRDRFFFLFTVSLPHRGRGEIGRRRGIRREFDGAVRKTVQQQVTSVVGWQPGGREFEVPVLSPPHVRRPPARPARGVISLECSGGFFVSAMRPVRARDRADHGRENR